MDYVVARLPNSRTFAMFKILTTEYYLLYIYRHYNIVCVYQIMLPLLYIFFYLFLLNAYKQLLNIDLPLNLKNLNLTVFF